MLNILLRQTDFNVVGNLVSSIPAADPYNFAGKFDESVPSRRIKVKAVPSAAFLMRRFDQ